MREFVYLLTYRRRSLVSGTQNDIVVSEGLLKYIDFTT